VLKHAFEKLCKDVHIVTFIELQRLRYLQRMGDARNGKKIYQANLHYKRHKGRPKSRWRDGVKTDIPKMGVVNCRKVEQDRERCRRATGDRLMLLV